MGMSTQLGMPVNKSYTTAQRKTFSPPKGSIRFTQIIDLSEPTSPIHNKRVLIAPVSTLPLADADAIQRIKLLAGPRWSPVPFNSGSDSKLTLNAEAGHGAGAPHAQSKDGWIKISEERFEDGAMNRKSASDVLDKLIEAANVSPSCSLRGEVVLGGLVAEHDQGD